MSQLTIPNIFQLQSIANPIMMDQNWAAVANFYNGNLSSDNVIAGNITNALVSITPGEQCLNSNFEDRTIGVGQLALAGIVNANIDDECVSGYNTYPVNGYVGNLRAARTTPTNDKRAIILKGITPIFTLTWNMASGFAHQTDEYDFATYLEGGDPNFQNVGYYVFPAIKPVGILHTHWDVNPVHVSVRFQNRDSLSFLLTRRYDYGGYPEAQISFIILSYDSVP